MSKVFTDADIERLSRPAKVFTDADIEKFGTEPKVLSDKDIEKVEPDAVIDPKLSPREWYIREVRKNIEDAPPLIKAAQQFSLGAVNEALLGFPLFALEKVAGKEAREALTSESKLNRIVRGAGSAAGFVTGLPAKTFVKGSQLGAKGFAKVAPRLATKAAKGVRGAKIAEAAAKGAGSFGLFELAKAPEDRFLEKIRTVPSALALGAGLGATGEVIRPLAKRALDKVTSRFRGEAPEVAKEATRIKTRSVLNNELFTSEREFLKGQGQPGKNIVNVLDDITDKSEIRAGSSLVDYMHLRRGLSSKEVANFVDVAEGRIAPMNRKVGKLVNFWNTKKQEIANEAVGLGLDVKRIRNVRGQYFKEIKSFVPRQNYFPHMVINPDVPKEVVSETLQAAVKRGNFPSMKAASEAWQSYVNYTKGKPTTRILDYLVKTKQATNRAEADKLLNIFIRKVRERRYANLERARGINLPFYDPNPDRVLTKYFLGAYHRLEEVKGLGARDELMKGMIGELDKVGGDFKNAQLMFDRWAGREPVRNVFGALSPEGAAKLRGVQTVTKLGLAQIPNATQSINTAYVTGLRNTIKGIKAATTTEGKEFALRTGAVLDSTLLDVIQRSTGGVPSWSRKFLKGTGFLSTERMNRVIAANSGREYTLEMTKRLLANPKANLPRRALAELKLDPNKILSRGSVTMDEILRASQRVVNKSQFRSGILDLPLWWTSPEGRVVTQFKNFAFNQAKLMKDAILGEMLKGNMKPAITALTLMPILGEGVADVKALLTGRKRDKKGLARLAENMSFVGGLGIVSDLWQSAMFGSVEGTLGGPTFSDLSKLIEGVAQGVAGKPKPLGRAITRQIPVAGPAVSRTLFPPENQGGGRSLRQLRSLR